MRPSHNLENKIMHSVSWRNKCMCSSSHMLDVCDCMWYIILLPCMLGMTFVLVVLTRLNVSEPEHWVTWSHRTGIKFPFLRGKNPILQCFCLNTSFSTYFYLFKLHLKNQKFLRELKDFCLIKSVLWWENWNLLNFDG